MKSVSIYGGVGIFYRIRQYLKDDFSALLPGSGYPFSGELFLRFVLYAGLILSALMVFLPDHLYTGTLPFFPEKDSVPEIIFEEKI